MTKSEIFWAYVFPVIVAALTAFAGFLGTQIKGLYQKYINDRTKEAVVRTCVKAVEQLYHDLNGPEKFEAAKKGVEEMLNEKGIPISELELNLLIESVVAEFNYGFARAAKVPKPDTLPVVGEQAPSSGPAGNLLPEGEGSYSEEEGASL